MKEREKNWERMEYEGFIYADGGEAGGFTRLSRSPTCPEDPVSPARGSNHRSM